LDRAIEFDPRSAEAYAERAEIRLKTGRNDLALADLREVLSLPARTRREKDAQIKAAETLMSLTAAKATPPSIPIAIKDQASAGSSTPMGQRIALLIGNSSYANASPLKNPGNDVRALAIALRQIGFAEVIEKFDLALPAMTAALKEFGDRTGNADWAVIYFSGHGIEMNGSSSLVPTDAKLERDAHIAEETIPFERMLEKVEGARKLRLGILDRPAMFS